MQRIKRKKCVVLLALDAWNCSVSPWNYKCVHRIRSLPSENIKEHKSLGYSFHYRGMSNCVVLLVARQMGLHAKAESHFGQWMNQWGSSIKSLVYELSTRNTLISLVENFRKQSDFFSISKAIWTEIKALRQSKILLVNIYFDPLTSTSLKEVSYHLYYTLIINTLNLNNNRSKNIILSFN